MIWLHVINSAHIPHIFKVCCILIVALLKDHDRSGMRSMRLKLSVTVITQLAFYVNLHRAVIGPSATLTGRWRPDIDLRRMLTGKMFLYLSFNNLILKTTTKNILYFKNSYYPDPLRTVSILNVPGALLENIIIITLQVIQNVCLTVWNSAF